MAQIDRTRQRGLDSIVVDHAPVLLTIEKIYERILRRLRRKSSGADNGVLVSQSTNGGARTKPRESFNARMRRWVLSFLALPDRERGWVLPAVIKGARLVRRERVTWIMTSCPPYSVHVVGLALKRLTKVNWVADFRDPWMTTGSKRLFPTSAWSLKIERWLERQVIERADLVVFNVERLRNAYRERYRHVAPEKLVFIPNAVSTVAIRERPEVSKYERFTLTYTGSLYLGRSPEPIMKALSRLITAQRIAPDAVRLVLVGQCDNIEGVPTRHVAARYGLEEVVQVHGAVAYERAMEMVQRSHLALLFAPDLPFQIPAKVYDYLATGTRILAIADDGGTADLVRDTQCGRAFASDDVDAIAAFIDGELHRGHLTEQQDAPWLARFDMNALTGELVDYMCRVGTFAEVAG